MGSHPEEPAGFPPRDGSRLEKLEPGRARCPEVCRRADRKVPCPSATNVLVLCRRKRDHSWPNCPADGSGGHLCPGRKSSLSLKRPHECDSGKGRRSTRNHYGLSHPKGVSKPCGSGSSIR